MKNKFKLGLLALAVLMTFGVASLANAAALEWTADESVDLSDPDTTLTIVSGSAATSLVVGTGTIQVVVPNADTFTVSSTRTLTESGVTTANVSDGCISGTETMIVTGGSGGETITITPGSSACASTTVSSGGGGGGSSGGSSSSSSSTSTTTTTTTTATTPTTTTTTPTPTTTTTTTTTTTAGTTGGGSYDFGTTVLKTGSSGVAVVELQTFLNAALGTTLSTDGAFGPMTASAVMQWQTANGLLADGLVGPMTKAVMNATATPTTPSAPTTPSTPSTSAGTYSFGSAMLKNGSTGEGVKAVQAFLNAATSAGLSVDGAFGPKTTAAVKAWQAANGLDADGLVGPMTKAKMNAQ